MKEGSLEAPTRHPIPWKDESFYDKELLDTELRRVFDICHGCRRCFNLCDSFPILFDVIDDSISGELDSVDSESFKPAIDACTLCDMCFLSKCPYVPPHEFQLDFPHLMLRYRAVENRDNKIPVVQKELVKTDRNGKMGCSVSSLANWATGNTITRSLLEKTAGIDKHAHLPPFASTPFSKEVQQQQKPTNSQQAQRKAVIYTTCSANYNSPEIAHAAIDVLHKNGVKTEVVYPECCGMPQMEHGDIATVAEKAIRIAEHFKPWIERSYDVIALTPSCAFMLKSEWPLIEPENTQIAALAQATFDISEYLVNIAKKEGLAEGLQPLQGDITLHIACHSRAQNIGQKAAEMLHHIPDTKVQVIERCSGHGGSWGVMKENFQTALKVGKPVAKKAKKLASPYMVSECPLAREHILQGMQAEAATSLPETFHHPVQLLALAYQQS